MRMNDPGKVPSQAEQDFDVEVEAELTSVALGPPGLVAAGILHYGHANVGPQPVNADFSLKLLLPAGTFQVDRPRVVMLQPRQGDNFNFNWSDQFAVQVITTATNFIAFRVRRLDVNANPTGWGQNLRVDILVIDDGTEA